MKYFDKTTKMKFKPVAMAVPDFPSACQPIALSLALNITPMRSLMLLSSMGWTAAEGNDRLTFFLKCMGWREVKPPRGKVKHLRVPCAIVGTNEHVSYLRNGVLYDFTEVGDDTVDNLLLPPEWMA